MVKCPVCDGDIGVESGKNDCDHCATDTHRVSVYINSDVIPGSILIAHRVQMQETELHYYWFNFEREPGRAFYKRGDPAEWDEKLEVECRDVRQALSDEFWSRVLNLKVFM